MKKRMRRTRRARRRRRMRWVRGREAYPLHHPDPPDPLPAPPPAPHPLSRRRNPPLEASQIHFDGLDQMHPPPLGFWHRYSQW